MRRLPSLISIAVLLGLGKLAAIVSDQFGRKTDWSLLIMSIVFLGICLVLRQRFLNTGIGGQMFQFIWVPVINVFILMRLMSLPENWIEKPTFDFVGRIQYALFAICSLVCVFGYALLAAELLT